MNSKSRFTLASTRRRQPEYGMEREAYAKLLSDVQQATKTYKLDTISKFSGISARYLREIRAGAANVSVQILQRITSVIPDLQAAHTERSAQERQLLDWARAECDRIGLRELAGLLDADPANLAKVLSGKRRMSRTLFADLVHLSGKSSIQ